MDVLTDVTIRYLLSENEGVSVIENILKQYYIEKKKMMRYARRRNAEQRIKNLCRTTSGGSSVRQKMKLRGFWLLLLVYTSLEAFRHIGWMLFYEQFEDCTRQEINFGFILYSGVIAITGMLLPLIFLRIRILDRIRSYPFVVGTLAFIALLFRMIQLTMGNTGAYIFLVLWTVAVMFGICICFAQIFWVFFCRLV